MKQNKFFDTNYFVKKKKENINYFKALENFSILIGLEKFLMDTTVCLRFWIQKGKNKKEMCWEFE